jgi:hypothetical protein
MLVQEYMALEQPLGATIVAEGWLRASVTGARAVTARQAAAATDRASLVISTSLLRGEAAAFRVPDDSRDQNVQRAIRERNRAVPRLDM